MRTPSIFLNIAVVGLVFSGIFFSCEKPTNNPAFTVTFDTQGGSTVKSKTVEKGQKVSKPEAPTREGYAFGGWYKDKDVKQSFDFTTIITGNITLYAKWDQNAFTVTFDTRGGSTVKSKTVEKGQKVSKPEVPTRGDYAFAGWYKDKDFKQSFDFDTTRIRSNITLYAKWDQTTFTVTFDTRGGSTVKLKTVEKGQKVSKPTTDPTRAGYTFNGWYKDAQGSEIFNFAVDKIISNITIYAGWLDASKPIFTVMFDTLGGVGDTPSQQVGSGQKVSPPPTPTYTGYEFVGWYRDSTISQAFDFTVDTVAADLTLYAGWGVKIPDANFLTKLMSKVPGAFLGNLLIPRRKEVKRVTRLDVSGSRSSDTPEREKIASLSGIEHFTSLTRLDCYWNSLTELDVSKNVSLTWLWCFSNNLTSLNLSKNVSLTNLSCIANNLRELDVSKNTVLKTLYCYFNQLTALDVSKNTALTELNCHSNQLTALDVSKNTVLTELYCNNNQLTALDVSKNTVLKTLYCYSNQLTELDVSKNTALTRLNCKSNALTELDIRGMRSALSVLIINAGSERKNLITDLKIHDALKNHDELKEAKKNREGAITIKTYSASAGSTAYTATCNNYNPTSGAGSCTENP